MTIQNPSFTPGCVGTVGFETIITNNTDSEEVVDFGFLDISATDDLGNIYQVDYQLGSYTLKCFQTELLIMPMKTGESIDMAFRVIGTPPAQSSQIIFTTYKMGRIENAKWVIDIPK